MQPEKKFKAGAVTATVWQNQNDKGTYASVRLAKTYKDRDNKWKESTTFQLNDLPKAMLVLEEAYRYLNFKEEAIPLSKV